MPQFYQGVFDAAGVADGAPLFVALGVGNPKANAEGSFSEKLTIRRFIIQTKGAPMGASFRVRVRDDAVPTPNVLAKFVDTMFLPPGTGTLVIPVARENRRMPASPKTLQFTVFNSDGADGRDPAAAFQVSISLELDRDTIGV